jgi:CRP-like cAMP-binding protein
MDRYEYFRLFHDVSEADVDLLTKNLKTRSLKKGEWITVPGQVQKELYFVKSGVQMSYFETERKTHVIAFTYPPDLCTIPDSLALQMPSKYYLSCLTDSELEYLSFDELNKLFDASQSIERLFRRMTETVLAGFITRHIELHAMTIRERYLAFCKRSPHLLQLVPHKYIASYLGIDHTNFSKLFNTVRL